MRPLRRLALSPRAKIHAPARLAFALLTLATAAQAQRRTAALRLAPAAPPAAPEPTVLPPSAGPTVSASPPTLDAASLGLLTPPTLAEPPLWPRLLSRLVVDRAVRLALEHANLAEFPTRSLATRARASAWMPQLSVRVTRGLGLSAVSLQQGFGSSDRASSDDSFAIDARLTLDLGRAVFAPEEPHLLRDEEQRNERRRQLEREVVDVLSALARATATPRNNPGSPSNGPSIETALLRARLEALTQCSLESLLGTSALLP